MNQLYCAKCHRGANSFIVCPLCGNQDICMDHCPTCPYFAGTLEWQCLYKRQEHKKVPTCSQKNTFGSQVVDKFRKRMLEIDQRIKEKKNGAKKSDI